eukprot:1990570-Prymnesium_polylepis.1
MARVAQPDSPPRRPSAGITTAASSWATTRRASSRRRGSAQWESIRSPTAAASPFTTCCRTHATGRERR